MRSKDIFGTEAQEEYEFTTADIEDYEDMKFNPVGVSIDDETIVDVVQNAQVIKSGRWENIVAWFNDNYNNLNGQFDISHQGAVLYTVKLAN